MRLMEYKAMYLVKGRQTSGALGNSKIEFIGNMRKIERLLCLLNQKASKMGSPMPLISRSLTTRLAVFFFIDLQDKQLYNDVFNSGILRNCLDR